MCKAKVEAGEGKDTVHIREAHTYQTNYDILINNKDINTLGSSSILTAGTFNFQHARFIPIVGVGKRGAYSLVHGDVCAKAAPVTGTTLRFIGLVPADSRL